MSMKRIISLLGLSFLVAVSCVKVQQEFIPAYMDDDVFYASIDDESEPVSKAYANEQLRGRWDAGDHISIFNKNTINREYAFQGQTGDNSGEFKKFTSESFYAGNPLDYAYAVYPYSESTSISDDGVITLTLPAEQSYRENTYGLGANTMIAVTDEDELMFKNLCGYLTLLLYGEDVTVNSISLKGNGGEPLAGTATVTASLDGVPTLSFSDAATNEISLRFDTPVTLGTTAETATAIWLVVPPATYESGITMMVETTSGDRFTKRTTGELTIARNTRKKTAPLEVVPTCPFLTFTSEGTTTVSLTNEDGNAPVLYYSTDKTNWMPWDYSTLTFTSEHPLYIYGNNPSGFSASSDKCSHFKTAGSKFSVSGSVMSLIDAEHKLTTIPSKNCFNRLFEGCTGLTSAPSLPATKLSRSCYFYMFHDCSSLTVAPCLPAMTLDVNCYYLMFDGCTSLTSAPVLPATTLKSMCYGGMFFGCSSLTSAPSLPATTLTSHCYFKMFTGCTSLREAPSLPATRLATNCYASMFQGCTKLKTAPSLPVTSLATACYNNMFCGCTSLTKAPDLPATTLAESCYVYMFQNCRSLTTAPTLPATTLVKSCYYKMFSGCKSLNYVECLATDISAEECVSSWLNGVASTGTFVKADGMDGWPSGASGIPTGWTVN